MYSWGRGVFMNSDELGFWKASFEALFNNSPDAIVYFDSDSRIENINHQFTKIFGYTHEQVIHKNINDIIDPEHKLVDYASFKILKGQAVNIETVRCNHRGEDIPVILRGIPFIVDGCVIGGFAIYVDLTNVMQMRDQTSKFSHALEFSPNSVVITDQSGTIEYVNRRFTEVTGYNAIDVIGKNPRILQSGLTSDELYNNLWTTIKRGESWRGEIQNKKQNGEIYWEMMSISSTKNDRNEIVHFVAIKEDITKRKILEQSNYYLAYHDPLTGLPNRLSFINKVNKIIEEVNQPNKLAVLFIDLDRFKKVNDSLGHDIGDLLLQAVAERLQDIVKHLREEHCCTGCEVFRVGGDEFTVILRNSAHAADVAKLIIESISKPLTIIDRLFFVTVSIGISTYPKDGEEINTLLRNADTAMYAAKELGKNQYQYYKKDMNDRAEELLLLEAELCQAVERQELELYYQPQLDMNSEDIIGYEALIRWNHPRLGLVPPGDFIPIAEESGLIIAIGEWVLKQACKINKLLQDKGLPLIPIAVNISAKQFLQSDFVTTVKQALLEANLEPHFLELEITESVAMDDIEMVISILQQLRSVGVLVSIDDFGTGYSSLSNFRQLPINKLKIDRSFIERLTFDQKDNAIVTSIINMAHSLDLSVIAEGVEDHDQYNILNKYKCNAIQGYLISKPVPLDALVTLLEIGK